MTTAFKKERPKKIKIGRIRWIISFSLTAVSVILIAASRTGADFADWYGFNVYPVFSGIGARIWGIFPFSAGEFFVISVILGAIVGAVSLALYIKRRKGSRIRAFLGGFSWAAATASVIFFLVTCNCLLGYGRTPFSVYSGLTLGEYTSEELKGLTLSLVEKANSAVNEAELDGNGRPIKPQNFGRLACESMEKAAEKYPVLQSYYPQPKAVLASEVMSSFNLAGIFFPVTVEANYNQSMPVSSQGFTACHELSHLSGFMREDEANYIAFIACRESDSPYFRYSGYLDALTYALNAYRTSASDEEYFSVTALLDPVILEEYNYRNEYWAPFRKKVTYKVSSTVNDAYLKANNQTDGARSYGRVVDLMLAEWKAEAAENAAR